jgi:hypothetical protein
MLPASTSPSREPHHEEDGCLFPMVDRFLAPGRQELLRSFLTVESEEMEEGTHERYVRLADELAERLGVPRRRPESAPAMPCCHTHR